MEVGTGVLKLTPDQFLLMTFEEFNIMYDGFSSYDKQKEDAELSRVMFLYTHLGQLQTNEKSAKALKQVWETHIRQIDNENTNDVVDVKETEEQKKKRMKHINDMMKKIDDMNNGNKQV